MALAASALIALLGWSAAAVASPGESQRSAAVDAVLACRGIDEPSRQLDCFRKAADGLYDQQAGGKLVVIDKDKVAAAKRGLFGFGGAPAQPTVKAPEIKQVTVKLVSLSDRGDGRLVFSFDDGSTWRETEPAPIGHALRPGQSVVIERGVLGGYFLDVSDRIAVRVARDRGA